MLDGLRPAMDDGSAQQLDRFAAAKARLDAAGEAADLVSYACSGVCAPCWMQNWRGTTVNVHPCI